MARSWFCTKCHNWVPVKKGESVRWSRSEHSKMHDKQDELFGNHDDLMELDMLMERMYGGDI